MVRFCRGRYINIEFLRCSYNQGFVMIDDKVKNKDFLLIKEFVNVFRENSGGGFAIDVPPLMVSGKVDSDGWSEWKLVDSPVSESDIQKIESCLGVGLPSLFRTYFKYKCLLMTDFIVRLLQIPVDEPLKELYKYISAYSNTGYYKDNILIPFGFDCNDAGYVCFDIMDNSNDDYPIVIVDSGKINDEGYRGDIKWGSFEDLIKDIIKDMESYG